MGEAYTGGCACGAIRYTIGGEPLGMVHCRCRDCQRMSGTGHGSYLGFRRDGVALQGEARHWDITADSGNVKTHGSCPTCGAPVYLTFKANPGFFVIHAASLDDPTRFKPQVVAYGKRAYDWDPLDPSLKVFEGMPPG